MPGAGTLREREKNSIPGCRRHKTIKTHMSKEKPVCAHKGGRGPTKGALLVRGAG